MLKLSTKEKGSILDAKQWDNRAKEEENVVELTGATLNSTETQFIGAMDKLTKANIYQAQSEDGQSYEIGERGDIIFNTSLFNGLVLYLVPSIDNVENATLNYAETGVNYISVGALTHQIRSLDISIVTI